MQGKRKGKILANNVLDANFPLLKNVGLVQQIYSLYPFL